MALRRNALLAASLLGASLLSFGAWAKDACKPVYLTFDTGHMGVAPLIAEVLQRQQVRVTFFGANEATKEGDGSLGEHWAPCGARAPPKAMFSLPTPGRTPTGAVMRAAPRHRPFASSLRPDRAKAKPIRSAPRATAPKSSSRPTGCSRSRARSRCRCFARRAARLRPRCWPRPGPAAGRMWAGRPRGFWATSCPASASATRPCWPRRCSAYAAVISCWRIWAYGHARMPGRPRCSSR